MNYTGIAPEYYYDTHKVNVPLQEPNSLAINKMDQLIFKKGYKRTEKMNFPLNHIHFLPFVMKKLLWNLVDSWNNCILIFFILNIILWSL